MYYWYISLNIFFSTSRHISDKLITKGLSTNIVNFIKPWERFFGQGLIIIKKMRYISKTIFLYSRALIGQTTYLVTMTKEPSTKIVNVMTPEDGVLYKGMAK